MQALSEFVNRQNCLVCESDGPVRGYSTEINDEKYLGALCSAEDCLLRADCNNNDCITCALNSGKLMKIQFRKIVNNTN